ncbi:hypothetical protein K8T06_13005 [bacterium]|nr:hypothetical protein [bacterium]
MIVTKRIFMVGMCLLVLVTGVLAQEEEMTSVEKAGKVLDKLLLETPHVYINASHEMASFIVPDTGIFFTGDIMLDAYYNIYCGSQMKIIKMIPPNISDIAEALSGLSELSKLADIPELQDSGIDFEALAELSELSQLMDLKKLEILSDAGDTDIEIRIDGDRKLKFDHNESNEQKMTVKERLDAFKIELMNTMLVNAGLFVSGAGNDMVIVVFQVCDDEYKTVQGASYLRTQISAKKLLKYRDSSASDPNVLKAFFFNW